MSAPISTERKAVYTAGMVVTGIGVLLFLSFFIGLAANMGDLGPGVGDRMAGIAIRPVLGMVLMIAGGAMMTVGAKGLAGSGLILDPDRARRDVEPWSRMAGGVVNDALTEVKAVTVLGGVKVRCRACQALHAETAKFCDQCGAAV